MKLKRIHLARGKALFLLSFFMVSLYTVIGMASPNGKPFQEIWEAIEFLQEQINNIELIPGPEGPEGPAGPEGPQGPPGEDGTDGRDAPGGIIVGILDPDYGETISGYVTIRAIIFGSEDHTLSILRNGTEIGTSLPMEWNSLTVDDGWWNITIVATDIATNNVSSDEVLVFIKNYDVRYIETMPNLIIPQEPQVYLADESIVHLPNSYTSYCLYRFVIPNNYVTSENIIFHLVWGAPRSTSPTIDYGIIFSYAKDGDRDDRFYIAQSSWTGAGPSYRNFETISVNSQYLNPGNLVTVKVYMENQDGYNNAFCYGVWLEVPVK